MSRISCDTCGTRNSVDTYRYNGNEWNICPACEVTAELAGEAYLADLAEGEVA